RCCAWPGGGACAGGPAARLRERSSRWRGPAQAPPGGGSPFAGGAPSGAHGPAAAHCAAPLATPLAAAYSALGRLAAALGSAIPAGGKEARAVGARGEGFQAQVAASMPLSCPVAGSGCV